MRYIILAGRSCEADIPKQLWKVGNETVIGRTIRLLKKNGVKDIAISTHDNRFSQFGYELLSHDNPSTYKEPWITAFYPTDEPTCYIFGDVVFSEFAIRTIVEIETEDIEFFGSAPPFSADYPKRWAEPFAFKVVDTKYFRECIDVVKQGIADGIWKRDPIAWELWQVIKKTPINRIDYTNFTVINDYTCDVDEVKDLDFYKDMKRFEAVTNKARYMIHACPKRMWYVNDFLIPSMLAQGIEKEQITVYNDEKHEGNLKACMHSFQTLPDDNGGTWHLQDDVIICRDFRKRTEKHNAGFIAGFVSQRYDKNIKMGLVTMRAMPWTFPCIRIPNKVARDCGEFVLEQLVGNPVYANKMKNGDGDDWAFKLYADTFLKDKMFYNLKPSLVDHIDWLIGGSAVGTKRNEPTRARYFDDNDLIEDLERRLAKCNVL